MDDAEFLNKHLERTVAEKKDHLKSRLIACLNELIRKAKIVACLRKILDEKQQLLNQMFTREQRRGIMKDMWTFLPEKMRSGVSFKRSTITRIKNEFSDDENTKADPRITSTIVKFYNNDRLLEFVKYNWEKCALTSSHEFVQKLKELKKLFIKKLDTTFEEQRDREKLLGRSWKLSRYYRSKHRDRAYVYNQIEFKMNEREKKKLFTMKRYNKKLNQLETEAMQKHLRVINAAERVMAGNSQVNDEKVDNLSEQAHIYKQQYDNMLEDHLREERTLRKQRQKVETVLANWIGKYDADVGQLHKDLEIEMEGYFMEKELMDTLEEKFNEQEEIYLIAMEERRLEEQRLIDMEVARFLRLRSAKIIQRWWHDILDRRTRRRKKSGKGKK